MDPNEFKYLGTDADAFVLMNSDQVAKASVFDNRPQTQKQVQVAELTAEQKAAADAFNQVIQRLEAAGVSKADIDDLKQKAGLNDLVEKTITDGVVLLQPYTAPSDFDGQYPQPLDPTEILTQCEEISVWKALPEVVTPFNADMWREMSSIDFITATGTGNDGFFAKGGCPDRITASGANRTVTRRHIGAQQTLSFEDIQHSAAVAAVRGLGINRIMTHTVGGPDVVDVVRDAKAKEIKKQEIIVLNNWDLALVKGSNVVNSLAFDGIETIVTAAGGSRVNTNTTGAFSIEDFDNFLAAGCARPTHIFGHPQALAQLKKAYLALGASGSGATASPIQQVVLAQSGGGVVPGLNLADEIETSVGRIILVPDFRFTATNVGANAFSSTLYLLRVYHGGEPIVYKSTQTPLVFKDLTPGCTAISFLVYAVTSLVIKHLCAQALYTAQWTGRTGTGCTVVAGTALGT